MIIKSLTLKNFECYYGDHEHNSLVFRDGLNLIIGDNGGGKSKLFDAFHWVLKDRVFNADTRAFVSTAEYQERLISDKAKAEVCVGDKVSAEVVLVAESSTEVEYRITRIFSAKKIGEREWESDGKSRLLIDEDKLGIWSPLSSAKHESVLRRVINPEVEPYMWFQGEQVDSMMDLTDKSTLTKVIELLSNIQIYDELLEYAKDGKDKAARQYLSAQRRASKDQEQADRLTRNIETLVRDIEKSERAIDDFSGELEMAKDKIEELVSSIEDATKKAALKKEAEDLERSISTQENRLNSLLNGIYKKIFRDYWVLRNSKAATSAYARKYNEYFRVHSAIVAEATSTKQRELPKDIPQPVHVNKMLTEERCFVCGREAKKGTPEYEHIRALLAEEDDVVEEVFKNDGSKFFEKLYNNTLVLQRDVEGVDARIAKEFSDIQDARTKIKTMRSRVLEIQKDFTELLEDDDSQTIVSSFKQHEKNREKYADLLNQEKDRLANFRKFKEARERELEAVAGPVDKASRVANDVYQDLFEVIKSTRNNVFDSLISELEATANSLFGQMTQKNTAITGRIKLKRMSTGGNYAPEIVDDEGYVIHSTNDSNIILVKLALIMAILISRGKRAENYALISDAPTSKMAQAYTEGFYETLSNSFRQSIVMTYDYLGVVGKSEISNFKLGSVYRLTPHYPSGNKLDRADLNVNITEVV